jgi:hypothetical protein
MEQQAEKTEGFTAQCACGKRYKIAAEKRGKKLRCKACGQTFSAEPAAKHAEPSPNSPAPEPAPAPSHVEAVEAPPATEAAPVTLPSVPSPAAATPVTPPAPVHAAAAAAAPRGGQVDAAAVAGAPVDPAPLLADASRGNLAGLLLVAFVIHVVVIGISSVSHVALCCKYGTFWPKPSMKREREDEEKRKLEAKQAEQERVLAEQRKAEGRQENKAEPGAKVEEKNESKAGKPKSKVEKALEEKSNERPKEPTIQLDSPNSLE